MRNGTMGSADLLIGSEWLDPLEQQVRGGVRQFLQELIEQEVTEALGRLRHGRAEGARGYRHGHRARTVIGSFGRVELSMPRARVRAQDGGMQEFHSTLLPRYKRLTGSASALIAGAYLAGVNTRRVRLALGRLFGGAVSKDTVSRAWRRVQGDFESWNRRRLEGEPIVRLILDGTVVHVRLDGQSTALSILVAMGVRPDGQKMLLGLRALAGESEAAWRDLLQDLESRGLNRPELVIIDGGKGLEAALAGMWPSAAVQRCTVHKLRNLIAHGPKKLHEELTADYSAMIYADTPARVLARRQAFLRKWRLRCPGVARSLEEAGERLITFLRYPPAQWRSIRTTNAIERLHEEFKRRIKTQCVLPCADTACMMFWALLASGQITLRKVDGWQTLHVQPNTLDIAA
ncbi:MAG: IS256 family transposase [Steroidobacteraceae bacterium]